MQLVHSTTVYLEPRGVAAYIRLYSVGEDKLPKWRTETEGP